MQIHPVNQDSTRIIFGKILLLSINSKFDNSTLSTFFNNIELVTL